MNTDVLGLIYASEENYNLHDLVLHRSVAALPVCGRYRAADFLLSNMVNSGITHVGIITQKNYNSLMDHFGSGKEWDLSRKNGGLFILPPFDIVTNSTSTGIYRGICDALNSKMDFIRSAPEQYCLLSGSYTIYSTSYDRLFREHIERGADVTMLYCAAPEPDPDGRIGHFKDVYLYTDDDGRVRDIEFDPQYPRSGKLGMDVYLIRKSLLVQLVSEAAARRRYNFVADILIPNLRKLKIYAVMHKGYVGRLTSIGSYFNINMDMLREDVRADLFRAENPIYTKAGDVSPAHFMKGSSVHNCVIGDGCEIYGEVEDSMLFRGAVVAPGAHIRGCVIMQGSVIQENCRLEHTIIDKDCIVRRDMHLAGTAQYPMIIRKGVVV